MILVDTSVWIDFLTGRDTPHRRLLCYPDRLLLTSRSYLTPRVHLLAAQQMQMDMIYGLSAIIG